MPPNNVIYNWGGTGLVGGHSAADHQLEVLGNYFIKGPASNGRFVGQFTSTDKVFQQGNYADLDADGQLNGRPVAEADYSDTDGSPSFAAHAFLKPSAPVTVDSAAVGFQKVITGAGASLHRDSVDARLIADLESLGTKGGISRSEAEVGGMGELKQGKIPKSTVGDGISDAWKIAHGVDTNDPKLARAEFNHDGYSFLEKYLNELAGDKP